MIPYDLIELKTDYNNYIIYFTGYLIAEYEDYLEIAYKLVYEADGLANHVSEMIMTSRIIERKLIRSKDFWTSEELYSAKIEADKIAKELNWIGDNNV